MSLIGFPPKPTGNDKESQFARWVWDSLHTLVYVNDVQGSAVNRTTHGTFTIPQDSSGSLGTIKLLVIAEPTAGRPKVVEDDYLICRTFSPAAFAAGDKTTDDNGHIIGIGDADVKVAKQYKHRHSIAGETVLDVDYTYAYAYPDPGDDPSTYPQNKTRTVTDPSAATEDQRITPPWIPSWTDPDTSMVYPGDMIFAIQVPNTGIAKVGLLDCCSSRQWAKIS